MRDYRGRPHARPHGGGVYISSFAPGPHREGPAWIWLEKKDAVELVDKLKNLSPLGDRIADDYACVDLFLVGPDAEGKTHALSAMRFGRWDAWWIQLNTGWDGEHRNQGAVQFEYKETAEFVEKLLSGLAAL